MDNSIVFKEGNIGRFHLHVPWNAIQSQPVQVKLDGVEFVVEAPSTERTEPKCNTKKTSKDEPQPTPAKMAPPPDEGYGKLLMPSLTPKMPLL